MTHLHNSLGRAHSIHSTYSYPSLSVACEEPLPPRHNNDRPHYRTTKSAPGENVQVLSLLGTATDNKPAIVCRRPVQAQDTAD